MIYFDEIGDKLTLRNHEILYYSLKGYKNREIADTLFIDERTVKNYRSKVYKILQVSSRKELISKYIHLLENVRFEK